MDIGRRIYDGEISRYEAAEGYGINEQMARNYMRMYRDSNRLPPKRGQRSISTPSFKKVPAELDELKAMTKEELIQELIKAKHYRYKKAGDPARIFPNLILSEMQIDGPMPCIVSDMTAFYVKGIYHELTLYMDLWNNAIVSHSLSSRRSDRMTYISGLEDLIAWKEQHLEHQMILHSDQGSVYAYKAYNDLILMYGITRSMSRAGTPTDNVAMESVNEWMKAEMFMDLHVTGEKSVAEEVDDYIHFFNEQRPAYTLGYLTPKQYRELHVPEC